MAERPSGFERDPYDWYVEPHWTVEALLAVEPITDFVWDPACGHGTIPTVIGARGLSAYGTDLVDRGFGDVLDFFSVRVPPRRTRVILSNPPYKDALKFVRHALSLPVTKVAILTRLSFLAAEKRSSFFATTSPARVWVLSRRPTMPPGHLVDPATHRFLRDDGEPRFDEDGSRQPPRWKAGDEPKGGSVDYCWIVWERTEPDKTWREQGTSLGWFGGGK